MSCTQHGTSSRALGFPTKLTSAPTRSKRTGEPGTQVELQECPINAEIWLPRLFTMQARAIAPSSKKKTLAPSRDSRRGREWISHDSGRSLSIARLPNAETSLVGVTYSTARRESFPELKGTRAWIVVPRWSWDSIESVPFRSFRRSSMLMRPSPRLAFAASMSKPAPESLTVR